MNNFIYQIFPEETIFALGLMLLHMMWQGLVIAMTLGIFLLIMRSSSAHARCNISMIALALFPVTAIITFIKQINLISYHVENTGNKTALSLTSTNTNLLESFLNLYTGYMPLIVFLWFTGICIFILRNLGGLIYIERLKNKFVQPVQGSLQDVVKAIKLKFGVKRQIRALISTKITCPIVVGHFKPVILIPKVAIENLSQKEMEIILHHEMAHIKRNDYIMNIFQIVIEMLFFFHPATWWISGIIRKEREECCDNYAVSSENDKLILAKALTSIQELNLNTPDMALSFMNKKNGLLNRIKNLFGSNPSLPSYKEGIVVTLFFFSCIVLMSFIFVGGNPKPPKQKLNTITAELPDGKHLFAKVDSAGNVDKLFVEGKKIKNRMLKAYQPIIDSLILAETKKDMKLQEKTKNKDILNASYTLNNASNVNKAKKDSEVKQPDKNLNFNLNINDSSSTVQIKADEKGFKLYVDDNKDKVEMDFNENGGLMKVIENGKTVVNMNLNEKGFEMNVNNEKK